MWTATIGSKDYTNGTILIGVYYTNGTTKFSESYNMTASTIANLNQKITNRLNDLNANDLLMSQVSLGSFASVAAVVLTPGPADVFNTNLESLKRMKIAIDLGILSPTSSIFTALQAKVASLVDPTFF